MAASSGNAIDIVALMRLYGTDDTCLSLFERLRWPDGPFCCRCGSVGSHRIRKRRLYECADCRYQYSVTSGTLLHRTHVPLIKWMLAAALLCNARKGVSAKQLSRDLGVTYKTAWSMGHRLRQAMQATQGRQKRFRGIVEVDETYVGGVGKGGKRGRGASNKTIVFGAKERHSGHVQARVIPGIDKRTMRAAVGGFVSPKAKLLIADQLSSYDPLSAEYRMERIHHKKSYTRGGVHTQGIESVWAILKRQYHGTHHWISSEYMPLYLAEIAFKLNRRESERAFEDLIRGGVRPGVKNGMVRRTSRR